ncbi:hypothetical protein [Robertmurraya massiliosenegalensis]|uniref:hypothetical protein n=1 Tax=Robertmurraya massiliosenegalensis TaxID=1287657 RepID=UPI00031AFB58|nr:hypothetical protein [Robertmurraya massiliosenegalensis]
MKRKIIASISIFILLFSLAWLWDHQNSREFYDPELADGDDEVVEIMPISNPFSMPRKYEVFKAREYVRIEEL